MEWINKYAQLLADYSLYVKEGDQIYIRSTTLAEPLVKAFYIEATRRGAKIDVDLSFEDQEAIIMQYGSPDQLKYVTKIHEWGIQNCNTLLTIRAPFDSATTYNPDNTRVKIRQSALAPYDKIYFDRLGDGSLKRSLCQYPTEFGAGLANMDLESYTQFIQQACFLDTPDPKEKWLEISAMQAELVKFLNQCDHIIYKHPDFKISFSVKGRIWINSDGKSNMPSGEVFTSPIEDSVNGEIYFSFPSYFLQRDVEGVRLWVKDGKVEKWNAEVGKDVLDQVFEKEGSRFFGEVAIGTNQNIQRTTKNILFDEKIGGTVHMALGQSYKQTGGKNESPIHWDLITEMKNGGEIWADGKRIYENGKFLM